MKGRATLGSLNGRKTGSGQGSRWRKIDRDRCRCLARGRRSGRKCLFVRPAQQRTIGRPCLQDRTAKAAVVLRFIPCASVGQTATPPCSVSAVTTSLSHSPLTGDMSGTQCLPRPRPTSTQQAQAADQREGRSPSFPKRDAGTGEMVQFWMALLVQSIWLSTPSWTSMINALFYSRDCHSGAGKNPNRKFSIHIRILSIFPLNLR